MCAIVDANVVGQVFGNHPSQGGRYFLDWLNTKGKLSVGGELLRELSKDHNFVVWLRTALRLGRARKINDQDVDAEAKRLRGQQICRSNDHHVLALARVSGARLLFTNDLMLPDDFRDRQIVGGAKGRVYTTVLHRDVHPTHRSLLRRNDLCNL